MKTGCISHPAQEPLIVIHRWQLEFCRDERGKANECAAALLSFFEYWHNIKLEMRERNRAANDAFEREGKGRPYPESLLQWHSTAEIEAGLLIFKRSSIQAAIELLVKKEVIEVLPNPVLKYDKTRHFLFHPEVLNEWLQNHRLNSAFRSAENSRSQEAEAPAPPFPQHRLKTAGPSAENSPASAEFSRPSAENSRPIPETSTETSTEKTTTTTTTTTPVAANAAPTPAPAAVVVVSSGSGGFDAEENRRDEALEALKTEFRLNPAQANEVRRIAKDKGLAYLEERVSYTRQNAKKNRTAYLLKLLHEDAQITVEPGGKSKRHLKPDPKPEAAPSESKADFSAELTWWQSATQAQKEDILRDPRFDLHRGRMRKGVTAAWLGLPVLREVLAELAQEAACAAAEMAKAQQPEQKAA
jgi:hypothetical protein